MRTFQQLLRIAFWMLPIQRVLTVMGATLLIVGQVWQLPFNGPGSTLPFTFLGAMLMIAVPLLTGGVLLRMLSASRALLLRPHARGRLLVGFIGVLLLVTFIWIFCYWLAFLPAPPKYQPGLDQYVLMFAMELSFGTLCAVTLFIASRSPLWTLLILLAWQAPGLLLHVLGAEDAVRLSGSPLSILMSVVLWTGFSIWFLRARRVHAGSWRRRDSGGAEVGTTQVTVVATGEQAMTRWLLGGASPLTIGLQCLAAAFGVLVIQWIFARDETARALQAMMFGTLALVGGVAGAVSRSMASHARGLWLLSGRSRLALFSRTERQMLVVMLSVFGAVSIATTLVWWLLPRPGLSLGYLLCAVLAPGLAAAWLGLMQQHQRSVIDVFAAIGIVTGWSYGLVGPLYGGARSDPWEILGVQVALAVLLREVAHVRWRSADWRRAQRA